MKKLGKLPRRHDFFLNPYQDWRFSRCPKCDEKTRLRKFALVIHVDPRNPVAMNKSCRYCPTCDLIIAHQDESRRHSPGIEAQPTLLFSERAPDLVGGTMDRAVWRQSLKEPILTSELLDHVHIFEQVLRFEPAHYEWVRE